MLPPIISVCIVEIEEKLLVSTMVMSCDCAPMMVERQPRTLPDEAHIQLLSSEHVQLMSIWVCAKVRCRASDNSRWTAGGESLCDRVGGFGRDTCGRIAGWAYAGRIERGGRVGPSLGVAVGGHRTDELIVIVSIYIC